VSERDFLGVPAIADRIGGLPGRWDGVPRLIPRTIGDGTPGDAKPFGVDLARSPGYHPTVKDIAIIHGKDAMKPPRYSIVKLMVVVGVVALNIPFYLFLMEGDGSVEGSFEGCFLMGVALQVGLFCSIRSRRTKFLPFWAGFEVFGVAAAITWIYVGLYGPEDWRIFDLWVRYLQSVYHATERICMLIKDQNCQARMKDFFLQGCQNTMYEVATFLPTPISEAGKIINPRTIVGVSGR
jgi:hypothetical protein